MSDLRLNVTKIKPLVEKVLVKLVNKEEDGFFDRVAKPLKELAKPLPGISEISGSDVTMLVSLLLQYHCANFELMLVILTQMMILTLLV